MSVKCFFQNTKQIMHASFRSICSYPALFLQGLILLLWQTAAPLTGLAYVLQRLQFRVRTCVLSVQKTAGTQNTDKKHNPLHISTIVNVRDPRYDHSSSDDTCIKQVKQEHEDTVCYFLADRFSACFIAQQNHVNILCK